MQLLLDQTICTNYGQLDLNWGKEYGFDGDYERFFGGQVNGLAGAASSTGIYLNLAHQLEAAAVRIELHEGAPDLDDQWEDVVEVSTQVPADASPSWSTWAQENGGPLALPPGDYRVRVSARGRDADDDELLEADDELEEEPLSFYLVELWPAQSQPDAIVRVTSENAQYWHRENGSPR